MGNKKKTKWRKVPSAELSQITVKNSIVEKTRSNDNKLYAGGKCVSNSEHIENNGVPEYYNPEEFPCPDQTKFCEQPGRSTATNGESTSPISDEVSGIYVNGLWIPVSQQKKHFDAAVPENILRTTPFLVPSSSAFCPSTCPRFQTIHAPDVPLHPNYFVPSSNHYLYYFFKGPPNCSSDVRDSRTDCPIDENREKGYRPFRNPRHFNHGSAVSTKPGEHEYNNRERRESVSSAQYPDCGLRDHQQDIAEEHEAPMYYYPGYSFGQQLCSVPLVSFIPPASVRVHSSHPWPVDSVHRKCRRRRRKGYAEYAVIPPKKNNPDSQTCVQSTYSGCRNSENNKVNKEFSTVCIPLKNDHKTAGSATQIVTSPCSKENKDIVEKDLPLYASSLCDQILSIARSELQAHVSLNIKDSTEAHHLGTTLVENELRVICHNTLYSIIDETVNVQDFSTLQLRAKNIKAMLNSDTNCETGQNQQLNGMAKQYHEDVKVHARRGCEAPQKDIKENAHESDTMYFLEPGEGSTDPESAVKEYFPNSESKDAIIYTQNNQYELMNKNADESRILNGNGAVSQEKTGSPETHPVTQQPRFESSKRLCHDQLQDVESREHETLANGMNIPEFCGSDLNYENKSSGSEINSHNSKVSAGNKNEGIASYEDTGENRDIGVTREHTPQLDTHFKEAEISHDKLSRNVPSSFASHLISSEALLRETELELNKLHQLTSSTALHATQSIYKLAYDENFTDQSENEDSDAVPQPQQAQAKSLDNHKCSEICRPLQNDVMNSEILVHEADSASEAGSEDVELLPHRYQSESVQDFNKHIYVNNLSLAVEMLRTHENLPYDDEFKRIVDEDSKRKTECMNPSFYSVNLSNATGRVNPAFIEETSSIQAVRNNFQSDNMPDLHSFRASHSNNFIQRNECRTSIADSGVQSGDSGDEMIEEAKDVLCAPPEIKQQQWHTDQTASYRRFGQQTRQHFSVYTSRASIFNPCLCCIIM